MHLVVLIECVITLHLAHNLMLYYDFIDTVYGFPQIILIRCINLSIENIRCKTRMLVEKLFVSHSLTIDNIRR